MPLELPTAVASYMCLGTKISGRRVRYPTVINVPLAVKSSTTVPQPAFIA